MAAAYSFSKRKPRQTVLLIPALLVFSLPFDSRGAEPPASENTAPRDFVVYLGLDILTDWKGAPCPVVAGGGADVEILSNGAIVRVPLHGTQLKTAMEPKLSRNDATIEDLAGDRACSPNLDDALSQQMLLDNIQHQSTAQDILVASAISEAQAATTIERVAADPAAQVPRSIVEGARREAAKAANAMEAATVGAFRSAQPGSAGTDASFDAFDLSFRISTAQTYDHAHGVLRLLVRYPDTPQLTSQVLKIFDLRSLGPKPRKVRLLQMGLPPGFTVESYSVHIYADGQELPTNLSRNRVDVTVDEAHQFLVLRHAQNNRQGSLPAQVVPELRSARLAALLSAEHLSANVELAISHEGRVTKILSALPDGLGPKIEAALQTVRFLPALLNGKPVASRGTFALGELVP